MAVAGKAKVGGQGSGDNQIECHKRIFHSRGKLNEIIIYLIYMRLMKIEIGKKKSSILIRTAGSGKDGAQREDFDESLRFHRTFPILHARAASSPKTDIMIQVLRVQVDFP